MTLRRCHWWIQGMCVSLQAWRHTVNPALCLVLKGPDSGGCHRWMQWMSLIYVFSSRHGGQIVHTTCRVVYARYMVKCDWIWHLTSYILPFSIANLEKKFVFLYWSSGWCKQPKRNSCWVGWFRGLTPQQQPGSYQGGEMMMKSVFWWRKPEHPEETTDLRQVTDDSCLYIFVLLCHDMADIDINVFVRLQFDLF